MAQTAGDGGRSQGIRAWWRRLRCRAAPRPLSYGIALGGGAARGAAHLGVLAVFEDAGLPPAAVAGTSIGAVIGAGYAAGFSAVELLAQLRSLSWLDLVRPTFSLSLANPFDLTGLARQLRDRLGLTSFSDLEIPFAAVACDIMAGEEVVLSSGDLVRSVLASAAIPGLFRPVEIDGRLLIDGGVVNNLPVNVVRTMGVERVVGVNLLQLQSLPEMPESLLEIWSRSGYLMIRANQPGCEQVDLLVEPALAGASFTDLSQAEQLFQLGRAEGERLLPELQRLLGC